MNILIIGDSWGTGAFDFEQFRDPTHPGLAYFLNQQHNVTNLSVRGGSNGLGIILIENFFKEYPKPDLIIWVQASWMRDARNYFNKGQMRIPTQSGLKALNINWDATNIDDIILPYIIDTCEAIQRFGIPTISVGACTKVHPKIMEYFDGIHVSATELVTQDFKDSYFENRHDVEMFSEVYLHTTAAEKTIAYTLVDKEMKVFINKYDVWEKSPYITMKHGNTKLHKRLYAELEKLL